VWLSEIILQQTRVDQGLPYWERFIETFPTLKDLANASESGILRLWEGLGYYSRARNLHHTAKFIHEKLNGQFPITYLEIIKLKGIGPYTAAAISSICFDEPRPVVDGNVFRFASRFFGIEDDISVPKTRKKFESILEGYIDKGKPGSFNQAMMEFGSTVCSPAPDCTECIFRFDCFAFRNQVQLVLPVKSKKQKISDRHLNYFVLTDGTHYLMKERNQNDIWKGLFDFISIEGEMDSETTLTQLQELIGPDDFIIHEISDPIKHILSHRIIYARFYFIEISDSTIKSIMQKNDLKRYSIEEILTLPKPKLIVNYLATIGIN